MQQQSQAFYLQDRVQVSFKVNYATEFGESLCIVGETEETGKWSNFERGQMQWTEGNWWKTTLEVDPKVPFQYKYVVIDQARKTVKRWESGINRICDPEYLPRSADGFRLETLVDEWEHFTVTFSVYLPT